MAQWFKRWHTSRWRELKKSGARPALKLIIIRRQWCGSKIFCVASRSHFYLDSDPDLDLTRFFKLSCGSHKKCIFNVKPPNKVWSGSEEKIRIRGYTTSMYGLDTRPVITSIFPLSTCAFLGSNFLQDWETSLRFTRLEIFWNCIH